MYVTVKVTEQSSSRSIEKRGQLRKIQLSLTAIMIATIQLERSGKRKRAINECHNSTFFTHQNTERSDDLAYLEISSTQKV